MTRLRRRIGRWFKQDRGVGITAALVAVAIGSATAPGESVMRAGLAAASDVAALIAARSPGLRGRVEITKGSPTRVANTTALRRRTTAWRQPLPPSPIAFDEAPLSFGAAIDPPPALPPVAGVVATSAVPEPATWLTMILGFGAIGVAQRRRATAERSARG